MNESSWIQNNVEINQKIIDIKEWNNLKGRIKGEDFTYDEMWKVILLKNKVIIQNKSYNKFLNRTESWDKQSQSFILQNGAILIYIIIKILLYH